jgi:hypothetical protein
VAAVVLTPDDLAPFADIDPVKAQAMIEDAVAIAATVAPCILTDSFQNAAAAKAIIRGAVLRWNEAGSGATTSETIGPWSSSTSAPRKGMFWPSEITDLQKLCSTSSGAFAVDTVSTSQQQHADICALNFGALYCSCGAVLTNLYALYEV